MEPRRDLPSPLGAFLLGAVPVLVLLGSTWMEVGPYAWAALLQVRLFDSYGDSRTFVFAAIIWIVLGIVAYATFKKIQSDPGPAPAAQPPAPQTGRGSWIFFGLTSAGGMVMLIGLLAMLRPLPPQTFANLPEVAGAARLWPRAVKLSLQAEEGWLDRDRSSGVKAGDKITLFAPVHAPGTTRIDAVCMGSPEAWQRLGAEGEGVLTLEPVPLLVRRAYAEKGLDVPLFRPVLRWGDSPALVGLPWLIAGFVVSGITAYLWHGSRKREKAA